MRSRLRRIALGLTLSGLVIGLGACALPMSHPADTGQITLVSTTATGGWTFAFYRNTAYPCSISGYQTFTIATKVGSSPAASRPLWVFLRGGGVGWFDPDGTPGGGTGNKVEETPTSMRNRLTNSDVMQAVRNDPAGFRMLSVSMCDHDIYAGGNQPDPNNPNTTPDGKQRTVNGLFATKAAVQFTRSAYPTGDFLLHGGSAGAYGSLHVGWALQQQGIAPAGIISDSGVLNSDWEQARVAQDICTTGRDAEALPLIQARLHPDLRNPANEPDELITSGRLTVPVLQIWSRADQNQCGEVQMQCPLPDGSNVTLGAADCMHEPLRAAIEALDPSNPSMNMRLCVDAPEHAGPCDDHVPTNNVGGINTDPAFPGDYDPVVLGWALDRLAA